MVKETRKVLLSEIFKFRKLLVIAKRTNDFTEVEKIKFTEEQLKLGKSWTSPDTFDYEETMVEAREKGFSNQVDAKYNIFKKALDAKNTKEATNVYNTMTPEEIADRQERYPNVNIKDYLNGVIEDEEKVDRRKIRGFYLDAVKTFTKNPTDEGYKELLFEQSLV